jgi:cell division protein ZapB
MANQNHIDQIAERVERLLVRYAELQRTNALLTAQVDALTHERDSVSNPA